MKEIVPSPETLKILCDLTKDLTILMLKTCPHLCVANFAAGCLSGLLGVVNGHTTLEDLLGTNFFTES